MKPKQTSVQDIYTPQKFDACQTPPYALEPLLPHLDVWKSMGRIIWEPAAGEGSIADVLIGAGHQVVSTDLIQGTNFFEYEAAGWSALVTNPPYSIKYKWLRRCYELGKPFALLLPVETIGSKTAQALMQKYGFEIMLLNQRIDFKMPDAGWGGKGAQFPVLWLCWKMLPEKVMFGDITEAKNKFKKGLTDDISRDNLQRSVLERLPETPPTHPEAAGTADSTDGTRRTFSTLIPSA